VKQINDSEDSLLSGILQVYTYYKAPDPDEEVDFVERVLISVWNNVAEAVDVEVNEMKVQSLKLDW